MSELIRSYPKARYQSLILQQITRLYVSLRGLLSDQLREIGFCRHRLTELLDLLRPAAGTNPSLLPAGGKCLLPKGCAALDDAVQHIDQWMRGEVGQVGFLPAFLDPGEGELHAADVGKDFKMFLAEPVAEITGHAVKQRVAARQHGHNRIVTFEYAPDPPLARRLGEILELQREVAECEGASFEGLQKLRACG